MIAFHWIHCITVSFPLFMASLFAMLLNIPPIVQHLTIHMILSLHSVFFLENPCETILTFHPFTSKSGYWWTETYYIWLNRIHPKLMYKTFFDIFVGVFYFQVNEMFSGHVYNFPIYRKWSWMWKTMCVIVARDGFTHLWWFSGQWRRATEAQRSE